MALQAPKSTDLFGDAVDAKEIAMRQEGFDAALNKSFGQAVTNPSSVMAIKSGTATFAQASGDAVAALETLAANKSLSPDALASLNNALASQRGVSADIAKEITLTVPLDSSFAAFDLEAPAKMLTPRPTPLRNKLPRKKGIGTSHRVKRILGYTGTGTGGVGNIWPGITQSTTTAFGSINYERGPQIQYAADDLVLPYNSYSLSDSVSWDAQFSGVGYQDLRQLSSTSTLYATMLMEERMLLMARGTASGYSGLLATPAQPTGVATAATSGQSAITGAAAKLFAIVTADAGSFGESAPSVSSAAITVSAGDVVTVTIPAAITGALGYNVYIGTAASTAPADSAFYYAGRTATRTFVVQGALPTTTKTVAAVKTQQAAGSNLSAYATGYDGILPTVLGPNTGYNNNINSTFSTSNPGVEYQVAFAAMYDAVKADPDEIFMNGSDRKQLSDSIKNGSTANYRLNLTQTEAGDYIGGATIGALYNEITGKMVPLTVHPWLPQGVSPILSYTLPIPDTQVSDVWSNFLVQDYMGVQWPVSQFQYEFSTYFRGTFMCQAPAWNGAVSGIQAA
jgi:hypothetical protein